MSQTRILSTNQQKSNILFWMGVELWFLCTARPLNALKNCIKFH